MAETSLTRELRAVLEPLRGRRGSARVAAAELEEALVRRLGRERYDDAGGYRAFAAAIGALCADGWLRPVLARGSNGLNPPLHRAYRLLRSEGRTAPQIELMSRYHPALSMAHYLAHPADYVRDKPYLDALDRWLRRERAMAPLAAPNERSFALFGDEKFLAGPRGRRLLGHVGLDLTALRCYPTWEPFFYYETPAGDDNPPRPQRNALIVENKDTFFTLLRHLSAGRCLLPVDDPRAPEPRRVPVHLLIYGEGKKIEHSLAFHRELCREPGMVFHFLYLGDLDPEGIAIFHRLRGRYPDLDISPWRFGYEAMLARAGERAPRLRSRQTAGGPAPAAALDDFLAGFPPTSAGAIRRLLASGAYLPQESLDSAWFESVLAPLAPPLRVRSEGGAP